MPKPIMTFKEPFVRSADFCVSFPTHQMTTSQDCWTGRLLFKNIVFGRIGNGINVRIPHLMTTVKKAWEKVGPTFVVCDWTEPKSLVNIQCNFLCALIVYCPLVLSLSSTPLGFNDI